MLLIEDYLKSLTIRSMQALGGLIIHQYFKNHNHLTSEIRLLVFYQVSVLVKDNLLEWENMGALLPINGRGDPNPESFENIDIQLKNIPSRIVDASTEIGLCALYTSDQSEALSFLRLLLDLTGFFPSLPVSQDALEALPRGSGWGTTINEKEYFNIIKTLT